MLERENVCVCAILSRFPMNFVSNFCGTEKEEEEEEEEEL